MITHDVGGEGSVTESFYGKSAFPEDTICPGGTSVLFTGCQLSCRG